MRPKIAFGVHVRELDPDSQLSVDEAVRIAENAGYEELVLTAHTYHPTDLSRLDVGNLRGVMGRRYPIRVSFAPEVNIRPRYVRDYLSSRRELNGVTLDLEKYPRIWFRAVILSLHFTAAIFPTKEQDSDTCPEQDLEVMRWMYLWALIEWERRHAKSVRCPVIIGHPFKYGVGNPDLRTEGIERLAGSDTWLEIPLRGRPEIQSLSAYAGGQVVLAFDAHNRDQFNPERHAGVLDTFSGLGATIFGERAPG